MSAQPGWIECVPNVSEGRDPAVVDSISEALRAIEGVHVLHVDSSEDANRTVFTFAGYPEPVAEGAFQLIRRAAELIDMRTHRGAHPRIGATDVCPFIPLEGATLGQCAELARITGRRVGAELGIPVFLYEAAASVPDRRSLSFIRKGEYEGLAAKLTRPEWLPDFGPSQLNECAGATVIGARKFLIAYNVNLETPDTRAAARIAERIRSSGSKLSGPGRLAAVKAIGWYMPTYGCAQVSCNLVDFEVTGLYEVFVACTEEAVRAGTRVTGSELIGLVPERALAECGQKVAERLEYDRQLEAAVSFLGLSQFNPFKLEERVIELALARERAKRPSARDI